MILNFDDELGKRHFEFCFVGFILGGSLQDKKGMTILRREMGLFEKLESISELKPCGKKMPNGEPERQLLNGTESKQIQINEPEFDLLYNYIATTPWQSGTPTRHALQTIDWLMTESKK
jgi:hypothetical protein